MIRPTAGLAALLVLAACAPRPHAPAPASTPHWGYEGAEGPEHWAALSPLFARCASGGEQSPVDLAGARPEPAAEYRFEYAADAPTLLNNGHTIQVNVPAGSAMTVGGERHELLQYHLHTPAEHAVDGVRHPMELHLVHRGPSGLAVLGVLLREGREHPAYAALLRSLPDRSGAERQAAAPVDPRALLTAPGEPLLPRVYRYAGSLTTPPCTEGVRWHVLAEPVELSRVQIESFRHVFEMNSRPLQPLGGRTLLLTVP